MAPSAIWKRLPLGRGDPRTSSQVEISFFGHAEGPQEEPEMAVLSSEEAEYIFSLPKRPVVGTIQWETGEGPFLNLVVPIRCDDGTVLEIRGWYNPKTGKFGLSLLHAGVYPIRRWDKKRGHRDP